MPSLPKTSAAEIVAAARQLLHDKGVEALSMNEVASAVGIRAPSLYKHFADRAEMIGAVRTLVAQEVSDSMRVERRTTDPARAVRHIARMMRTYGVEHPHLYGLITSAQHGRDLSPEQNVAMMEPMFDVMKQLAPRRTRDAARLLTCFVHGFVQMEINGGFRLAGDLDASFDFGLDHIIRSLKAASPSAS